jgi:isoprenylcysteine carboxyl methyltransferase (ICMT) family protein YpbQ
VCGLPALPLDEAGTYVAGAYIVFIALLLVYVTIIGRRIARSERQLGELVRRIDRDRKP